ncbi:MAG: hypothetical protein AB7Q97_16660 [Gammaproteobacteria bacterium]
MLKGVAIDDSRLHARAHEYDHPASPDTLWETTAGLARVARERGPLVPEALPELARERPVLSDCGIDIPALRASLRDYEERFGIEEDSDL